MNSILIEQPILAAHIATTDLESLRVSDIEAVVVIEGSQVLAELDLGSCSLSKLVDPLTGNVSLMIQTSTGHFASIPSDFFVVLP